MAAVITDQFRISNAARHTVKYKKYTSVIVTEIATVKRGSFWSLVSPFASSERRYESLSTNRADLYKVSNKKAVNINIPTMPPAINGKETLKKNFVS